MADEIARFYKRQKVQKQFIATSEYTQSLLDKIKELEKENAKLSKMLNLALDIIGDFLLSYETYPVMLDRNITKEDRNTIYAELEKRVENEK